MIYTKENLFKSKAKVLVNPVNIIGVMGAGIALEFKNRFPYMFKEYKQLIKNNDLHIGYPRYVKSSEDSDVWICLFPTKIHFSNKSCIEYIEKGLMKTAIIAKINNNSYSFPKLGCGCGGLNFEKEVKPLVEKHLYDLQNDIYIHI